MPASSQASSELSTHSLTAVSSALRGLSKPSRWRFLVKNSETEISRWFLAIDWAVARAAGAARRGGAISGVGDASGVALAFGPFAAARSRAGFAAPAAGSANSSICGRPTRCPVFTFAPALLLAAFFVTFFELFLELFFTRAGFAK